ncbi:hypothetical protein Q1695_000233 [Nippostrongylus brasiliensis]|nr:hypothetical protein Q1695_000233 [Nippostrongylus brasiliensis]
MQHSSRGRVPSNYNVNMGESYTRRDWNSNVPQTITFHGKRSSKRLVIGVFLIAIILLIAAIVIIILFLTGVLSMGGEIPIAPVLPPIVYPPTSPPVIVTPLPPVTNVQNYSYACTFLVLRQANAAYDVKSSDIFISAFRMVQSAVSASQ